MNIAEKGDTKAVSDRPACRGTGCAQRLRCFIRAEWRQLGCCLLAGLLLATLPNWIALYRTASTIYLADEDEVECYAPVLSQAYRMHPWKVGDPALAEGGDSLYPRLQFVPAVLLAKILCWEPVDILFIWRIFAGLSLSLVFYLLTRDLIENTAWATVLTILMLSDQGFVEGQPLRLHLQTGWHLLSGDNSAEMEGMSRILRQFRLITPGVSWVWLGAAVLATRRWTLGSSAAWFWTASVAFGLLFYVYFYYWVAFTAALGLAALADNRRWRRYAGVLVTGGALGVPSLVSSVLTKATAAEGWLERMQAFSHGFRGQGFVWPKGVAVLLLVCAGLVWYRHRDLLFIWCLAAVAMVLSVHESFTGIIMQNHHYSFVWGPVLCLLAYVLATRELRQPVRSRRWVAVSAIGIAAAMFLSGLSYRAWEATHNRIALAMADEWARFRSDGILRQALSRQRGVLAGDRAAIKFAVFDQGQRPLAGGLVYSHSVTDRAWTERRMLDLFLADVPVENAVVMADTQYTGCFWAAYLRDGPATRAEYAERTRLYREIKAAPSAWLRKYGVTHLVLPVDQVPSDLLRADLTLVANGNRWTLWACRE